MARKGSDVRGATIAKAASQVIVGCGYLTDVIYIPLHMACGPVQVRREGNRSVPRPYTGSGCKPPLWAKFMG